MKWYYLWLLIPLAMAVIVIIALVDLKQREIPSRNVKQLLGMLILFPPPLFGTLLYYLFIVRPNRFPKPPRSKANS